MQPCYRYHAELDRVVDDDTLDVIVDLGFYIRIKEACRERQPDGNRDEEAGQVVEMAGEADRGTC